MMFVIIWANYVLTKLGVEIVWWSEVMMWVVAGEKKKYLIN